MAKLNNLAFDYSAYDAEVVKEEQRIKHKRNAAAAGERYSVVKIVLIAAVVMALMFSIVYGKAELSGIYEKQTELDTELTQLLSENVSLESELATKTGLSKVEEYAENQLGLKKLDKSQIEYVEVKKDTVAQVVEENDKSVAVKFKNWFSDVMEYIGAK